MNAIRPMGAALDAAAVLRPEPQGGASAAQSGLHAQEQALLDLIRQDSQRQCAAALAEATQRADAVHAQAQAQALARLRGSVAEQRQQLAETLAAARSRLATQRRLHEQQRTAAMLALAGAQLPGALQALWAEAATRSTWVDRVAAEACSSLPHSGWQVRHASGWPDGERQAWLQALAGRGIAGVALQAEPAMGAGLKVLAAGNVIDGSLAGLMADRHDFESRLLRALEDHTP